MDDEELGFEDLGVQFSDVVASLEDLGSGHWSDEDLWILAATPASELTAGQREFLRDHVLRCRLCYQALGHFRRADSMTIEVPSMPVALRAELLATWTSWQAQRIVFAIMVLAGVAAIVLLVLALQSGV